VDPAALRPLARTGLEVSALGLGTAPLGELFERVSDADATGVVDAAWDAGVRYLDTSPFYGHGKSEIRVGRALDHRPRADVVLSTKVGRLFRRPADPAGFRPSGWVGALPLDIRFDYSYDGIMRSVEDSYLRLGTNTIDVLFVHDLDEQFHPDPEVLAEHRRDLLVSGWRALEMLKAAGVIGGYGAGINDRASMRWFLDHMEVDVFLLALRYTLLEHDVLDDELPRCAEAGTGLVVGGVYNSGILATGARPGARYNYGEAPPEVLARTERIEVVCREFDVPLAAAALQFPLGHPLVASVIPGALSAAHVEQNVAAFRRRIPDELWSALRDARLLRADAPVPTRELLP
jgi:D-threo-aldose 1-dehydrogenase